MEEERERDPDALAEDIRTKVMNNINRKKASGATETTMISTANRRKSKLPIMLGTVIAA